MDKKIIHNACRVAVIVCLVALGVLLVLKVCGIDVSDRLFVLDSLLLILLALVFMRT